MDEQHRIRESAKFRLGQREFDARIRDAEAHLDTARVIADPEDVEARELELAIAQKERELFIWRHDTTGAFKGDQFGEDICLEFESMGFKREADGSAHFAERGERTHMLLINMGELDRLNESGDHALGDKALELTFARIQQQIRECLIAQIPELSQDEQRLESMYAVYRTGGADFSVMLKGVDAGNVEEIKGLIIAEPLDVSSEHPGEEPTYLTASNLSFAEAGDILARLHPENDDLDMDENMFVTVLKEKSLTLSDFERTRARLERVVTKIREGYGEKSGENSAETLYTKYHRGTLGPLFSATGEAIDFSVFEESIRASGALEETEAWQGKVFNIARTDAIQKFHSRNAANRRLNTQILESVLGRIEDLVPNSVDIGEVPESGPARPLQETAPEDIEIFEQRTEFLGKTRGEQRITEFEEALEAAEIEDSSHASLKRKKAEITLEIEHAERDHLTGLAGRGIFFQKVERQFREGGPVSIMSIDMAFLKFFDKEGGKHTGDTAIRTAAHILDYVARTIQEKHGIDIEACRVGGDEFTFSIASADPTILSEIEDLVRDARIKAGPIPAYSGSLESYTPETLQFNLGVQSAESPETFREQLSAMGVDIPEDLSSSQTAMFFADHLSHMADGQIGPAKTISRLSFLLNRGREIAIVPDDEKAERQMTLRTLMAYSDKAIFGEAGRQKMSQWLPQLIKGETTVAELIRSEIIPFVREQSKRKGIEDIRLSEEMEITLEYEIRLGLSEQRIRELERHLQKLVKKLGHEHDTVLTARRELKIVEEERDEVIDLRHKIKKK